MGRVGTSWLELCIITQDTTRVIETNKTKITHLESIRVSTEHEIVQSITRRSTYLIQNLIAIGVVIGVYFTATTKTDYAPFFLLFAPLITFLYITLILKSFVAEQEFVNYLKLKIEPELSKLCKTELDYEFQNYSENIDYYNGKIGFMPTQLIYLIVMWCITIISPIVVITLIDENKLQGSLSIPFLYIFTLISIIYAIRTTFILKEYYKNYGTDLISLKNRVDQSLILVVVGASIGLISSLFVANNNYVSMNVLRGNSINSILNTKYLLIFSMFLTMIMGIIFYYLWSLFNNKPIVVTAAVIVKDNKILIAQRKRGDPLQGKWEFPGGKIEETESPEACLKRELFEEFGIDSRIGNHICSNRYRYPHVFVELIAYKVTYVSGDLRLNSHQAIKWVTIDELSQFVFAEADMPIVKKIKDSGVL